MDKRILNKIAKDWAKSILIATAMDCEELDDILSQEEQDYIVEEVEKVADRITKDKAETNLVSIVAKYYEIE
jgi:formate-dependent phosphoribosylglycinamide formyltransferase (GAR transformylase)